MNISITLPTAWSQLSSIQYQYVLKLITMGLSYDEIKGFCLFRWAGIKVKYLTDGGCIAKYENTEIALSSESLASALNSLSFIEEIPSYPINIASIGKYKAVNSALRGVKFCNYLAVENLYQGYLVTRDNKMLIDIAKILYSADSIKLDSVELLSIFYWVASIKVYLSGVFRYFFQPVDGNSECADMASNVVDAMNAQIRALTHGDVTKEEYVLDIDTWRALTELDAVAKESKELNRKYGKK